MKPESVALLDYFHLVCGKDYKLFTVSELAKSGGANVTEEEIVAIIDRLDKDGYVDLRYCDGKEILLKPLNKAYSADVKLPIDLPTDKKRFRVTVEIRLIALFSFIGGIVGAIIGVLIARAIC